MKRTFSIVLIAVLALSAALSGCSAGGPETNESAYTYDHIAIVLPEGFTVDESGNLPIAVGPEYPDRTDNITFSKGGADSPDNYSREILDDYYAQILTGFEGSVSYDEFKISGVDAIKYSYKLNVSGVEMMQTQYLIFGSTYSDIVTFVSVSGDYDAAFNTSASTITVKK